MNGVTNAIVTGGTRGIGLAVGRCLVQAGFRVVLTSRRLEDAQQAAARICAETGRADAAVGDQLELGVRASVTEFADRHADDPDLRVLVNNAGLSPGTLERTAEGFEMHFGVNYLGHLLLDELLLETISRNTQQQVGGVIGVGSLSNVLASRRRILQSLDASFPQRYIPLLQYAASKAALHLLMRRYALAFANRPNVAMCSIYPGFVDTAIYEPYGKLTQEVVKRVSVPPESTGRLIARLLSEGSASRNFYHGVQWPLIESRLIKSDVFAKELYGIACSRLEIKPRLDDEHRR